MVLVHPTDIHAVHSPCVPPFLERGVVQGTAVLKHLLQLLVAGLGAVPPLAVCDIDFWHFSQNLRHWVQWQQGADSQLLLFPKGHQLRRGETLSPCTAAGRALVRVSMVRWLALNCSMACWYLHSESLSSSRW